MPNKTLSLWTKSTNLVLRPTRCARFPSDLKLFQWYIYFQILAVCTVQGVFIFPLRLSPQYYIPGLMDPPPSEPYSIHNALKYSHSPKSAQEITNEFMRRFSKVSKVSRSSKKQSKTSPKPNTAVIRKSGIDFALPLNYEIKNPNEKMDSSRLESIEEKLVLIVFKLPVRKYHEKQIKQLRRRTKRQIRKSLQFYEQREDSAATEGSPSRTLSLGKKIRTWWEGGARPTSAYPKFRPTRPNKMVFTGQPQPFAYSGRPFYYSDKPPTTSRSSNKFLFGKFLKGSSTRSPPRPPPTKPKPLTTASTTKNPHLTYSDYTFSGPGCHPRGPKLILCSTDRIEHLSLMLEKFMHYQERNNLSPYFIDTEEEDSDSYGSYGSYYQPSFRHYGYRGSGKIKGRSRKPFGNGGIAQNHPSVVVLAMNNKDEDIHEEDEEHHSSSHSHEGRHRHKENEDQRNESGSKEPEVMTVKGESNGSTNTKSPRSKRNKRKLRRGVRRRSEENVSSSSEEESFAKGHYREDAFRDRYLPTKREIEDERDAEYKRLKRLLKLIKRYQEIKS